MAPDFATQLIMTLFLVLPLALIILIATRGRKFHIKDGYVHIKLLAKYPFTVAIDSLSGVAIKPVGIRAGHIQLQEKGGWYLFSSPVTLHNIVFPMRARKLINISTSNRDLSAETSKSWLNQFFATRSGLVKPTIRAYPWVLLVILMLTWLVNRTDATAVIGLMFILPIAMALLISYFGSRYQLKNGVITAYHLLKRNKQIKLDELESLDLELIGLMAGHLRLKSSNGVVINMKNIPVRLTTN